MDSLMNATIRSITDRVWPTRLNRKLPANKHIPARASTSRHRLEGAHNPQVGGRGASPGYFETRMPGVSRGQLVCSRVVHWSAQRCMRGRRGWRRSLRW